VRSTAGAFLILAVCGRLLAGSVVDPRHLARSGRYGEAAEIYRATARDDPAAAVGLARALVAQGRRREAAGALVACRRPDASVHAERARLAFARGEHAEAQRQVDAALRLAPEQLLARWLRGELHRVAGRLDEADEAYAWLVHYYNDHDVACAESLHWIAQAAAQYARWNRLHDQFDFLVNDLYPDALELEPDFWPAPLEMGRLYLEKFNEAEAQRCFEKALALNPQAAEVHAALAELHLVGRDVAAAEAAVTRALEANAELAWAWRLRAELHWANFEPAEAARVLREKALPLDRTDEETLGRLAACYAILDRPAAEDRSSRLAKLIDEVNARNPHAGVFYLTLGGWLQSRHKTREAEQFLLEARRRMPRLVGPRAELALLYMKAGREEEARRLFAEAFEIDPFNLRTSNMLKLLDVLGRMKTVETERVIVRYDARHDEILARYMVHDVDATCAALCKEFGYTPERKPLVEIFSAADGAPGTAWFGTRMTGLPYVGTVAASSGPMVGMVSPGSPGCPPFNWSRVLRHELVHVVTLQQTDFDIPHWFTEALAVHSEQTPRPHRWNEILRRRHATGALYTLRTINFGFTRPSSGDDWHLAYCQAELYLDYMTERFSKAAVGRLLGAYAKGLDTPAAIRQATGVSEAQFERGYADYVDKLIDGLSGLVRRGPERPMDDLLAKHRKSPDDPDAAAELALAYLRRGARDEAAELVQAVVAAEPAHALAGVVAARLLLAEDKPEEAAARLERCLDRKRPQADVLELLASLRRRAKEHTAAAELYALGHRLEPANPAWLQGLARVYLATKDNERLAETLAELARLDPSDLGSRKKLARLALDRGDFDAAYRFARESLEIDVRDGEIHGLLGEALAGQARQKEAVEELRTAVELSPEALPLRLKLARGLVKLGRAEEARTVLERLLEKWPEDTEAKSLLESLPEEEDKRRDR